MRIDLFGDEIETIRPFDRETQRSEGTVDSITIAKVCEWSNCSKLLIQILRA